jgi:hypothetical protein
VTDITQSSNLPLPPSLTRYQIPFTLITLAAVIAALVGVGAWFAGAQYSRIRSQQVISELAEAQSVATKLRLRLHQQEAEMAQLKATLHPSNPAMAASQVEEMRRQILRLQAEVNSYQNSIDRDRKEHSSNRQLINFLATPQLELIPLQGPASSQLVAYALVAEQSRLLLIASNFPKLAADRDYQLWFRRKDEPTLVSGGVFDPDDTNRAIVPFSNDQ